MKKNILKIILFLLILIALIVIGTKIYLFSFVRNLEKKAVEILANGYHMSLTTYDKTNDIKYKYESWITEKNEKGEMSSYSLKGETEKIMTTYKDNEKKTVVTMNESNYPRAYMSIEKRPTFSYIKKINKHYLTELNNMSAMEGVSLKDKVITNICSLLSIQNVRTDIKNDKECYVVYLGWNNMNSIAYIDKTTCLPIVIDDGQVMYTYEFGIGDIKKEDVEIPDISEYHICVETIVE